MRPLNPFLRAFFASRLPATCAPASQYIILVPTAEFLLTHRDKDTQASYHELATSEELISCHVIRATGGAAAAFTQSGSGKESGMRDTRGKARQYTTLNGRTVVIKDAQVFTNKGFKSLVQAQILHDSLYYNDASDVSQWLVYYISRPLVGSPELLPSLGGKPVSYPGQYPREEVEAQINGEAPDQQKENLLSEAQASEKKGSIDTLERLLTRFPVVSRHMQTGLDNLFRQFRSEMEEISLSAAIQTSREGDSMEPGTPLSQAPTLHRRDSSASTISSASIRSGTSRTSNLSQYVSPKSAVEEQQIRRSLESLVYSAIDVFQSVDKQQLSLVGASTDLSGPAVERLIEKYVTQYFHESVLFPRLQGLMATEDDVLERNIRQMVDVDISQVGLSIEDREQRVDLNARVKRAVEAFKKMNEAECPLDMIDVLLNAQRCLTINPSQTIDGEHQATTSEKGRRQLIVSADMLVSLLLIVVIRSPVSQLQARLAYMRDFVFVIDVDLGEVGYALSTYEAVIGYLTHNADPLKAASRANRALWAAARRGDVAVLHSILNEDDSIGDIVIDEQNGDSQPSSKGKAVAVNGSIHHADRDTPRATLNESDLNEPSGLGHVFPFQSAKYDAESIDAPIKPKLKKKVSVEARSMSGSSIRSHLSGSSTLKSLGSMAGETSPQSIVQTQDASGRSALLIAVESGKAEAVNVLLSFRELYNSAHVLSERTEGGATLLSVAMQLGEKATILALLTNLFLHQPDKQQLEEYLSVPDVHGRSALHYAFNAWWIIAWLDVRGFSLPWNLRDRNGQTPLFAICRSYDQEDYQDMVQIALRAATKAQGANEVLYLDDHVDNKHNTLLHIIKDPQLTRRILNTCDADPNAVNERNFTPLMVASKYARLDQVRTLFGDPRVDFQARDHRGLTAVELAKDDEIRNRIDDMVLLSTQAPMDDGRITSIVRSFFVDDGTVRLILKSAAPNGKGTITVTTSRRSTSEFEVLSRLLLVEHPASWMPSVVGFRSPFQIPSKPSRMVLRDLQLRLDEFLKCLMTHPTFSTHEMLWEFFLVPDIDPKMLAERAEMKAEARIENLHEEYDSVPSILEVEAFAAHAREQVNSVHRALKQVIRRVNVSRNMHSDLLAATRITQMHLGHAVPFLPKEHITAFGVYTSSLQQTEHSPLTALYYTLSSSLSTTSALQNALSRPASLIAQIHSAEEQLTKHNASATRTARLTTALGLLEDLRARSEKESLERAGKVRREIDLLRKELRYTQTTIASELAGWQVGHAKRTKESLRDFARRSLVVERTRLEGLNRALRACRRSRTIDGGVDGDGDAGGQARGDE